MRSTNWPLCSSKFTEDIHAGIGHWQALENYQSQFFGTPLRLFLQVGEPLAGRFDPRRCGISFTFCGGN